MFDRLPGWVDRPRFFVPEPAGGWRPVTWGYFGRLIREVASYLAGAGFAPGDRAAVFAPSSVEWAAAGLGIQAAGGVLVPIYPASTAEQAAYVLAHSGARFAFAGARERARLVEAGRACPALERLVALEGPAPDAAERWAGMLAWSELRAAGAALDAAHPAAFDHALGDVSLDRPGLMLYTSGTTGVPKGVPLTHLNVGVNGADWLGCIAPLLRDDDVDLAWLPMSHIFGFGELCLGNLLGFTTYLVEPAAVLARLPEVRPTVFMSVPSVWEKLAAAVAAAPEGASRAARLAALTGGRLRLCLSGGAGLAVPAKELLDGAGLLVIEGYGLTETGPTLTLNRPDAYRFDSVGRALPSVELRLAPDGEIEARGPSVFSGYHADPDATRAAFTADGWFRTGDVGRFTSDGFLQIVDRKKDLFVTSGGKNVAPAAIELRFRDDPAIAHAAVYGDGKRYLVAGLWTSPAAAAQLDPAMAADPQARARALHAFVRAAVDRANAGLARFEQIKRFFVCEEPLTIEAGFLTPTLKLRRRQVHEAFRARFELLYREEQEARP